ncbi:serine hydrolase [Deinococcus sp.]|uniref:serine hydrolase domain-containing protein n=1 Tax=Deinococcus sp. TaxID=47478 RepID=UPI002869BFEA|nr:serine hydrolase [Deinococcus sp.]
MPEPTPLPRCSPEAQGLSSRAVLSWLDALAADDLELHSFMLLRADHVIAEGWWSPYSAARPHHLYSLSKSFTSTAAGCLVADGRLDVDDRVVDHFPESVPDVVGDHLAAMRVRDLLTMRTGHARDVTDALHDAGDGDWVKTFLAQTVEHTPGTHFVYSSAATFMLSALVQRLTGTTLLAFLRERLAPLNFGPAHWIENARGVNLGGWGLHLTTEGIVRFGQLYLNRGHWQGEQVLPAAWVDEATRAHVPPGDEPESDGGDSDWAQGYGYQFWRCRHGAYRADGAFGQFCVVMPRPQAVLAVTAGVGNMQRVLDHTWAHLLAGMGEGPLPTDAASVMLRERCAALSLAVPDIGASWHGTPRDETYRLGANEEGWTTAQLVTDATSCRLTITGPDVQHGIDFGLMAWRENQIDLWGGQEQVLARAGRQPDDTLALTVLLCGPGARWEVTAQHDTLTVYLAPPHHGEGRTVVARLTPAGEEHSQR